MGIRTRGFEKVSRNSSSTSKEKTSKEETAVKTEPKEETSTNAVVAKEVNTRSATANNKSIKKETSVSKSPVKLRTPATMARLGMKAAARKLKKHRKRRLYVQTATKILRSSIKTNKTRRPVRLEEKTRNTTNAVPSRVSTRTLIRRTSREGIPEAPLRTVELIKRPLELREPATKLLYMASLGLYPRTGESDMTPIVVIRELTVSPGKKNGVRKSLELPLIPQYHKRVLDLANQNKNKVSETAKQTAKQPSKREARKSPPSTTIGDVGAVKKSEVEMNQKKVSSRSSSSLSPSLPSETRSTATQKPVTAGVKDNNNSSAVRKQQKLASPPPPPSTNINALNILSSDIVASLIFNHTNTTVTPAKGINMPTLADAGNILASNSKSLLKSNLSPPSNKPTRVTSPASSFTSSMFKLPSNVSLQSDLRQTADSLLNSPVNLSDAMSLFMPNITILPTPTPTSSGSRKRPAATNSQISNSIEATNLTVQNYGGRKPPKKKPKNMVEENVSRHSLSLPPSVQVSVSRSSYNDNAFLKDLTPIQNTDEALNLCVKKRLSDPPSMANMSKLCAKPENNNNNGVLNYDIKVNGPKPLNLIIPRPPPPLTKAPMEITNIANCSQNVHPAAPPKPKSQSVKVKKSRQNHNQLSQSNLQLQQILPTVLPLTPEANVHAKSLLKCMNGEENTCVREIGESLDSVKTMLARLQTRIGPAVNGVRLITIE